jgi:histidine triad (HIT) family protein
MATVGILAAMADCVFCRIASGDIPATILHRDDLAVAFADIDPQAPFHAVVIPRTHVAKLGDLDDARLGGHLLQVARRIAADAGHGDDFRLVSNSGTNAGQTVAHLHMHVLAGRRFTWPPG